MSNIVEGKNQTGRVYRLYLEDKEGKKQIEITNLSVDFRVLKKADNTDSKNFANINIFNLRNDHRALLESKGVRVSLEVGYYGGDMQILLVGEVVNTVSEREVGDIRTTLTIVPNYSSAYGKVISSFVPEGSGVKDVINTIARFITPTPSVVFSGDNVNKRVMWGYPINSKPIEALSLLSRDYSLEWQLDNGVLYISDKGKSHSKKSVFQLSERSGFIGSVEELRDENFNPEFLVVRALINPVFVAGSFFELKHNKYDGIYKVVEVEFIGSNYSADWYMLIKSKKL